MSGSVAARDEFVRRYHARCRPVARRFARRGVDLDDLEQIAVLGLLKAADRYEAGRGGAFWPFARVYIVGELMHYVRDQEALIPLPRALHELHARERRVRARLTMELGREPATAELLAALDCNEPALRAVYQARGSRSTAPLEELAEGASPAYRIEERALLHASLQSLERDERAMLLAVYGLRYSQSEAGRRLGYSQRSASRLHQRALDKLAQVLGERNMQQKRGFTLIELMIVVAIIAVLAGVLIPNFVHARSQTATAACESNLRAIATAAELYYTDNQAYPATTASVDRSFGTADGAAAGTYLNNTPVDPAAASTNARYTFTNDGGNGVAHYTITCPGLHDPAGLTKIGGNGSAAQGLNFTSDSGLGVAH